MQAADLAAAGRRSFEVVCAPFLQAAAVASLDADAYAWWQSAPALTNELVLSRLRRMQRDGSVRLNATAYVLFDHSLERDMRSWASWRALAVWQANVSVGEGHACGKSRRGALCDDRREGTLTVAAIPLRDVP
mmetsp:Transcript_1307/g.3008  ORF Transcript_1307/g.3008 Transcript_1307/m.3008 type:complete len:133 (-) Transcript_1307:283-681(-)